MKTTFSETILIAMLPFVIASSNLRDWVAILLGILLGISLIIHIVWRIKNWNKLDHF